MKKYYFLLLLLPLISTSQVINIPDANFKAKLLTSSSTNGVAYNSGNSQIQIDANGDGEIQISEALVVTTLNVGGSEIQSIEGIQFFTNLNTLKCSQNQIAAMDVSALVNLTTLDCDYNQIAAMNVSASVNLMVLNCEENQLSTLDLSGLTQLQSVMARGNILVSLDLTGCSALSEINVSYNLLTQISLADLVNLTELDITGNELTSLNVSGLTNLQHIQSMNNLMISLDAVGCTALTILNADSNQLMILNVSGCASLSSLSAQSNQLTSMNLDGCIALSYLDVTNNAFTQLEISNLPALTFLSCSESQLTSMDISGCPLLSYVRVRENQLTALDLSGHSLLDYIDAAENQLTSVNVSGCPSLVTLALQNNQLTTLNVSECTSMQLLLLEDNNLLTSVFMKNGINESFTFDPTLTYICADESQIADVQQSIDNMGSTLTTTLNSYCTFEPGGTYNTITGIVRLDSNNNGCDPSDPVLKNLQIDINDGTNTGGALTNTTGSYSFFVDQPNLTLTPLVENASYFNISPVTAAINFPTNNNNVQTQDFCIAPNGVHPDAEIVIVPADAARPGFDASYTILYKNKGTEIISGTFEFFYDDAVVDFITSSQLPDLQNTGSLSWNYANLTPFETRAITVTINVNSPMEIPAVNNSDVLNFTASISPVANDGTVNDNVFTLSQTVVNSFDPNDKICLQGNNASPTEIGKYLHYVINFENTGTASAVNVVVKDMIDISKFDIASLQMLTSSHPVRVQITGNKVEFIFENIQLQPNEHGNAVFKLKTKSTLVANDIVTNKAEIFFDYNFPIVTNTASTIFQLLGTKDFAVDDSIQIYPNPANDFVNIRANGTINSLQLFDVQGRIIRASTIKDSETRLDISHFSNGIYFIKINTDKGTKTEKLIKN